MEFSPLHIRNCLDNSLGDLQDPAAATAWGLAIEQAVRPGSVVAVLDFAFGIFALLAARAGAGKVYAFLQRPEAAMAAASIAADNGFSDRIVVIASSPANVSLPEKADLVICGIPGNLGIDVEMQKTVGRFCQLNLASGGQVIPDRISCFLVPLSETRLKAATGKPIFKGLDLSFLDRLPGQAHSYSGFPPSMTFDPPAAPCLLESFRPGINLVPAPDPLEASFDCHRDDLVCAFLAWFRADMLPDASPDLQIENGPGSGLSSWLPWLFELHEPIAVQSGGTLTVSIDTGQRAASLHWVVSAIASTPGRTSAA